MEHKKHTVRRFTVVDLALLILLFLILLGGGGILLGRYLQQPPQTRVTYTLLARGLEGDVPASAISVGDAVYSENGSAPMGQVRALSVRAHPQPVWDGERVVIEESDDRFDLFVTVEALGQRTQTMGVRVSDIRLAAGGVGAFCVGSVYLFRAEILSVEVEE